MSTITVRGYDSDNNYLGVTDSVTLALTNFKYQRGLADKLLNDPSYETYLSSGEFQSDSDPEFSTSERFFFRRAEGDNYFRIGHGYWSESSPFEPSSANFEGQISQEDIDRGVQWIGPRWSRSFNNSNWVYTEQNTGSTVTSSDYYAPAPIWYDGILSNGVNRIDFKEDSGGWLQWKWSGPNVDFGWYNCWARPSLETELGVTPNHDALALNPFYDSVGERWVSPHEHVENVQNYYFNTTGNYQYLTLKQPDWSTPTMMNLEGYYAPNKIAGFHKNSTTLSMGGIMPYRWYK